MGGDYSKSFDDIVKMYNEWLALSNKWTLKRVLKAYLEGASHNVITNAFYQKPADDLTKEQWDLIMLASDLKRVENSLDKILKGESVPSVPLEQIKEQKELTLKLYETYKNAFLAYFRE